MERPPASVFREGLEEGHVRFQRCRACASAVFYPRVLCPVCGSGDLAWQESAKTGTVYSATTIHSRDGARQVLLVDLDEGFRMMGSGDGAQIGDRVRARVDGEGVVFERG